MGENPVVLPLMHYTGRGEIKFVEQFLSPEGRQGGKNGDDNYNQGNQSRKITYEIF
jgi:hypothetical protein